MVIKPGQITIKRGRKWGGGNAEWGEGNQGLIMFKEPTRHSHSTVVSDVPDFTYRRRVV